MCAGAQGLIDRLTFAADTQHRFAWRARLSEIPMAALVKARTSTAFIAVSFPS
jgi:hypothetical protein